MYLMMVATFYFYIFNTKWFSFVYIQILTFNCYISTLIINKHNKWITKKVICKAHAIRFLSLIIIYNLKIGLNIIILLVNRAKLRDYLDQDLRKGWLIDFSYGRNMNIWRVDDTVMIFIYYIQNDVPYSIRFYVFLIIFFTQNICLIYNLTWFLKCSYISL